jgi:hypothetical protein
MKDLTHLNHEQLLAETITCIPRKGFILQSGMKVPYPHFHKP